MSVLLTTREQTSKSPVNSSTAKQLFSFSKGARFNSVKRVHNCDRFYDLPTTRLKRTTSFGFGPRANFVRREASPPPGSYKLPSDFDTLRQKGKMFSFGISRGAYSKVYVETQPVQDSALPGPGSYEVREVPGKNARKAAFRPKTTDPVNLMFGKTPGPGSYEILPGISPRGPQFYSKFESSRAAAFHPPSSKRFTEVPKEASLKPGPGHYPVYPGISKSGVYFLSNFKSSLCRSFGGRYLDHTVATAPSQTPGPGTYRVPSDFGEYSAQEKYIKETQRLEEMRQATSTTRRHKKSESQAALLSSVNKTTSHPGSENVQPKPVVTENIHKD